MENRAEFFSKEIDGAIIVFECVDQQRRGKAIDFGTFLFETGTSRLSWFDRDDV
jgi:hypothetical protein